MRKIDHRSILKNLPADQQDAIVEYARLHSSDQTANWLRAQGVAVSRPTVGRFLAWRRLNDKTARDSSFVKKIVADIQSGRPGVSQDELDSAGHMMFSTLALVEQDSMAWKRVQRLQIDRDMLKLAHKKSLPSGPNPQ